MAKELTFQNVRCVSQEGKGVLRLDDKRLGWKGLSGPEASRQPREWAGTDLTKAEWSPSSGGGNGLLKLCFGSDVVRFADLEPGALPKIKEHLSKCFKIPLAEQQTATAGWSWGDLELRNETSLSMMTGEAIALEVDVAEVNQVACAGKQELNLELLSRPEELLCGIRFFVSGQNGELEGPTAESIREELVRLAKTSEGQMLAHIQDVAIVAPRGKHDLLFYAKSLQIRGKSQSYTLKWEGIKRLFVVDLPGNQKLVVVGLAPPIRNGKMYYNFLGLSFDHRATVLTEEAVPKASWEAAKTQGSFSKSRGNIIKEGDDDELPKYEVVVSLLKEFTGQKIPQPVAFKSNVDSGAGVACTFVTDRGHLYFFQKQFCFVKKPIMWKLWADILGVEFRDTPMRKSSFDLKFVVRDEKRPLEFTQIEKRDQKQIFTLLEKISDVKDKIRNLSEVKKGLDKPTRHEDFTVAKSGRQVAKATALQDQFDEDDDEDFDVSDGGEDDEDAEDAPPPARKKLRSSK